MIDGIKMKMINTNASRKICQQVWKQRWFLRAGKGMQLPEAHSYVGHPWATTQPPHEGPSMTVTAVKGNYPWF